MSAGLAALGACLCLAWSAEVYRWIDEQGVEHFSGQQRPGAQRMIVEPRSTVDMSVPQEYLPVAPQPEADTPTTVVVEDVPDYRVRIANLIDGDTVWNDARQLDLDLAIEPPLAVSLGHRIDVYVDGELRAPGIRSSRVRLTDIDRGEHTLQARVVDAEGRTIARTAQLTIYHKQHSLGAGGPTAVD